MLAGSRHERLIELARNILLDQTVGGSSDYALEVVQSFSCSFQKNGRYTKPSPEPIFQCATVVNIEH